MWLQQPVEKVIPIESTCSTDCSAFGYRPKNEKTDERDFAFWLHQRSPYDPIP